MYKVFIKESSVTFTEKCPDNAEIYHGIRQLEKVGKRLEEAEETEHLIICHPNLGKLWGYWCSRYEMIEAAGGIVVNDHDEILLIHRLGKWDLPKGKLEPGEGIAAGAKREVVEECDIPEPVIVGQLPDSYHTYRIGDKPILKRTYWFEMHVKGTPQPTPQHDEDITEAIWCPVEELEPKLANSYASIVHLIRGFLAKS